MKFDRNLHLIERGRTGANVGGGRVITFYATKNTAGTA